MLRELAVDAFPAMGGAVEVQFDGDRPSPRDRLRTLVESYERALSRFLPDSDLSRLNAASGCWHAAPPVLFDVVSRALEWAAATDGLFDPTVIDALEAAGYDRSFEHVRDVEVRSAVVRPAARRWHAIEIDARTRSLRLPPGVRLDLGGIGKGYIIDRVVEAVAPRDAGVMINALGDLYARGSAPGGGPWLVGVQDPFVPRDDLALLAVRDCGVATSATWRRSWLAGGERQHHLIDPREGRPGDSDLVAVTVVALTATAADVLAKCALLAGSAAFRALLQRFPGVEAIAIARDGARIDTPGMQAYLA